MSIFYLQEPKLVEIVAIKMHSSFQLTRYIQGKPLILHYVLVPSLEMVLIRRVLCLFIVVFIVVRCMWE
jgi:hypothetical protein